MFAKTKKPQTFLQRGAQTSYSVLSDTSLSSSVVEELQVQILKLLLNNKDKATVGSLQRLCLAWN